MAGGRDHIALAEGAADKGALQRLGRALQTADSAAPGQDDAGRRLRLDLADLDEISRADTRIGALQAVDAQQLQPLIFGIGADRAGGGSIACRRSR